MGGKIPCFPDSSPSKNTKKNLNQPHSTNINEALQKESNIPSKNRPNKNNLEEEKKDFFFQNKNPIINQPESKGDELKEKNIQKEDPLLNDAIKTKDESKKLEKNKDNEYKQIEEVKPKNFDQNQTLFTNNDKKEEITAEEIAKKEKKRFEIEAETKRKQEEEMKLHQEKEKENNKKKSLEHKIKGNEYYTAKNFQKAIEEYTIAIVSSINFYIKKVFLDVILRRKHLLFKSSFMFQAIKKLYKSFSIVRIFFSYKSFIGRTRFTKSVSVR